MERNRGGRPRHPDVLTPAEWRVLEALRDGGTNAEIGARLGISADAVKHHISNMLGKLELRDRRALAAWHPEERRGRLPAWFAVPAAIGAIARPVAWVGIGTAAVAGVVVGVVAAVVAVAVVLVVVTGDGEPSTVVRAPLPTPEATSTPAAAAVVSSTPSPAASPTATASPTPTVTPQPTSAPEPRGPVIRYDRFDRTGEVSTPGSYAFLMPEGDGTRVAETYGQLRTEPRVLQVSATDADGNSRASFYGTVATDDVLEWRTADDCWVRYRITELLTGTATLEQWGVEPYSYAYGGCFGTVPGTLSTEFRWHPPNLSSGNVSGALMHGPVFVAEQSWGGTRPTKVMDTPEPIAFPPTSMPDPDLGPEWSGSVNEGYGGLEGHYDHTDFGWTFSVYIGRLYATPDLLHEVASTDKAGVKEYLLIDGRHPAVLTYDADVEPWSATYLVIYDLATDVVYSFEAWAHLRDQPYDLIEIARKFMVVR